MRYLLFVNMKWLLVLFGIFILCGSGAVSRSKSGTAEQDACYEKFSTIGLSERQVWEVSDREVLDVCGSLPRYEVNRVWHINRDAPNGVAEKATELLACNDALKANGLALDAAEASDGQLIRICGPVPALLD